MFRKKRKKYSKWSTLIAHIREYNWHIYRTHPYYTILKQHMKYDKHLLKKTYTVLKHSSYTTQQITQYIYSIYANKLYEITLQHQHPKWFQMIHDVHDIVKASSMVIEQDIVFRKSLINTM